MFNASMLAALPPDALHEVHAIFSHIRDGYKAHYWREFRAVWISRGIMALNAAFVVFNSGSAFAATSAFNRGAWSGAVVAGLLAIWFLARTSETRWEIFVRMVKDALDNLAQVENEMTRRGFICAPAK